MVFCEYEHQQHRKKAEQFLEFTNSLLDKCSGNVVYTEKTQTHNMDTD